MPKRTILPIAEARKAKGLSQAQLAAKVGAHWITISKLERGKMRLTFEWANRLALALDISVSHLFNMSPEYRHIIPFGRILDNGIGNHNAPPHFYADVMPVSETFFSNDSDSFWFEVATNDYAPAIQASDLIRATVLADESRHMFVGRLCVTLNSEDNLPIAMGLLYPSVNQGDFELRLMNGVKLTELKTTPVFGVMMIISSWTNSVSTQTIASGSSASDIA